MILEEVCTFINDLFVDLFINSVSVIYSLIVYFLVIISDQVGYAATSFYDVFANLYNLLLDFLNFYTQVLDLAVGWIGNDTFEAAFALLITMWLIYVFLWALNLIKTVVRFFL
ncbi:MAG: hypothetical protein PHQ11_11180 [Paludibacter sp.]|jgi:hypothetical protein|nr:hypothetical protein [Paludibacter sp.]MDD4429228.1 hypothetical protein [Paludibacter sp.]